MSKLFGTKAQSQDGFGRNRGMVSVEGKTVNLEMVKAGYTAVYWVGSEAGLDSVPY